MTTFQNRKTAIDALATVFAGTSSWQEIYKYFPSVDEVLGKTPWLLIRGRGTSQRMNNLHTNPRSYRVVIASYVLAYSAPDNWTSLNAEEKTHDLDLLVCQTIRDNVANAAWNSIRFDEAYSQVDDIMIENLPYIREMRTVFIDLANGAV
jgi:hypothetical protein